MIWLILGTGVGLLFGAIAVRLVRRIRGASATPATTRRRRPDDPAPSPRSPSAPRTATPRPTSAAEPSGSEQLLASSAVMAAGTVVSRLSGFVRSLLLAAALGNLLHADLFTIANTIPNMLYILLAGGVFNAVLVPQLVRAMKNDADGGEAYTNRVITLAGALPRRGHASLLVVGGAAG